MKLKLRLGDDDFAFDYAKFLALAMPFMALQTPVGWLTPLEPLAPLLLWFALRGVRHAPGFTGAYVLYCAVSLLSAASVVLTDGLGDAVRSAVAALRQFLIFSPFLLVFLIRDFSLLHARAINDRFLIGCGIAVYAGLALHYLGITVVDVQARIWVEGQGSFTRAGGLTGNTGAYGLQIALWATAFFLVRPALGQRSPPWLTGLVMVGVALALFNSASRGGVVQLVAALALGMALSSAVRIRPGALLLGGTAALMVFWAALAGVIEVDGDSATFAQLARLDVLNLSGANRASDSGRIDSLLFFTRVAQENLALGVGYKLAVPKFNLGLDNAYLLTFVETGVIGGLLFLAFWISLLAVLVRRCFAERWFAPVALALVAAFMLRMAITGAHTAFNAAPGFFVLTAALLRLSASRMALMRRDAAAAAQKASEAPRPPAGAAPAWRG